MRKFLTALLMTITLASTGVFVSPKPASAACVWCSYQSIVTGRCIDDSFQFGLRSFPCNGQSYQKWTYGYSAGKLGGLINRHTGRCIDDSFQFGLRSFPCNGQNYQFWVLGTPNGKMSWRNVATGRYIDDSEYGLRSWQFNGMDYQRFRAY